MHKETLQHLLEQVKTGALSVEEAIQHASNENGLEEMGFATLDTDRLRRTGMPEVIYAAGKTVEQVKAIAQKLHQKGIDVLATRATPEMYEAVQTILPAVQYNAVSRVMWYKHQHKITGKGYIAVVAAGTSDLPVAEEAVDTARFLGNEVKAIYDVGVAGIHRLFDKLDLIRGARVVITVAGMEGALGSVVGGLVDKPVIGVPTSIGYGANFQGVSALLSMLNSCSSGISVVNIDNGFGAACQASLINKLD